jgi:hypothetical protein
MCIPLGSWRLFSSSTSFKFETVAPVNTINVMNDSGNPVDYRIMACLPSSQLGSSEFFFSCSNARCDLGSQGLKTAEISIGTTYANKNYKNNAHCRYITAS